MILIHRPWDRQPGGITGIDWGNSLTRGLIRAFHPTAQIDVINQASRLQLGAGHGVLRGESVVISTGGSAPTTYGDLSEISGTTQFTTLCIATPTTLALRAALWTAGPGSNGPGLMMGYGTSSMISAYVDATTTYVGEGASGTFVANERATFGWVYNNAHASTKNRFFKGNRLVHSANNTGAATGPSNGTNALNIGGPTSTGGLGPWQGSIELILVWNRALSDDEYKAAAADPWQVFAGPDAWLPVYLAAGGAFVFNPMSGRGGPASQILMAH